MGEKKTIGSFGLLATNCGANFDALTMGASKIRSSTKLRICGVAHHVHAVWPHEILAMTNQEIKDQF